MVPFILYQSDIKWQSIIYFALTSVLINMRIFSYIFSFFWFIKLSCMSFTHNYFSFWIVFLDDLWVLGILRTIFFCLTSVTFYLHFTVALLCSRSVVSDSLWPHGLQHTRLPCTSLSPGACSDSCPLSWWCRSAVLSSVAPFSSCLQSFPGSGSFPMSGSSHQVTKALELQLQHQSF